ncbi:MAG: hypothetical protein JWN36_2237 [Microbacteriaceae bacterium]|nr:hypothetical protein [Microbacteriaceae bacterium]
MNALRFATTADGWPSRDSIDRVWSAVVRGRLSRERAHAIAVPWVEGPLDGGWSEDPSVTTALVYLHGLDMAFDGDPNLIHHGAPGTYYMDEASVAEALEIWRARCARFDRGGMTWAQCMYTPWKRLDD